MLGSLKFSPRVRAGWASCLVVSFILGLSAVSVPGCQPEGVGSFPKMKGKKDDMQKEGIEIHTSPGKGKGKGKAKKK